MEPIRVPVTFSPHLTKGLGRGYYLMVMRLFKQDVILTKQQFVGFSDGLIVTACRPPECDTILHMAIRCPTLGGHGVTWLSEVPIYPFNRGFRAYIPGRILRPRSAEDKKVQMTGIVMREGNVFYVQVPGLSGDILLGRKLLGG